MVWFVIGLIAALVAVAAIVVAIVAQDKVPSLIAAVIAGIIGLIFIFISTFYTNDVQQAKVKVNFDGTIAGVVTEPGAGFKAPWSRLVDFDLSSQQLTFAGNKDSKPDYSGGKVNGGEITTAVKGGSQANIDLQLTYNIEPGKVKAIYSDYRSQENFSAQVIVPTVLSAARKVPAQYDAVTFRGDKQGDAQEQIVERANAALDKFGVNITVGALQNIRYSDTVEKSIAAVQEAQQKEQRAQAELRAAKVAAQQKVVQAKAEADANREIAKSLSPEVLQSKQLDVLRDLGEKGNTFVVPNGTNPLLQVK